MFVNFVVFTTNPTRLCSHGGAISKKSARQTLQSLSSGPKARIEFIDDERHNALMDSEEPSKLIAEWFGLPYQKTVAPAPDPTNMVELFAAGEDCAFDQPCRFGHRVEDHAVYCHNQTWVDAPRKCRRTWYTGGKVRDEDCPGFEPHPVKVG